MRLFPFPRCCGAMNLVDFPFQFYYSHIPVTSQQKDRAKNSVIRYLQKIEKGPNHSAFMVAILTDVQRNIFGNILQVHNWKLIDKRKNPNSARTLFVYLYRPPIKGFE